MNKMQFTITNVKASLAEILPAGISLVTVLGFFASIFLSKYLLNAIAAFLAKTMQSITSKNSNQLNGFAVEVTPKKKPIKAKGSAKMECANKTSEKYFFIIYINIVFARKNDEAIYPINKIASSLRFSQ